MPPVPPSAEGASPLRTAELLVAVVEQEAAVLLRDCRSRGAVAWCDFSRAWQRLARRAAAGETAADDLFLSDLVGRLRQADGRPLLPARRKALITLLHGRLDEHLARRPPGCLAARLAALENGAARGSPESAARWILALDGAGLAAFRALAVIANDPGLRRRTLRSVRRSAGAAPSLEWLQACMVEAARQWPATSPGAAQSRRSSTGVILPAFGVAAPPPVARRFEPDLWLASDAGESRLVAFQPVSGACEARRLLPTIGATFLAVLLRQGAVSAEPGLKVDPDDLPPRLDPALVRLRFDQA